MAIPVNYYCYFIFYLEYISNVMIKTYVVRILLIEVKFTACLQYFAVCVRERDIEID